MLEGYVWLVMRGDQLEKSLNNEQGLSHCLMKLLFPEARYLRKL